MTDIITIITAALAAAGGGAGGAGAIWFILKSHEKRIDANAKGITKVRRDLGGEIGQFKRDNNKEHGEIYKRVEEEEDCVESELQTLNEKVGGVDGKLDKVITVMRLTTTDDRVLEALK